MVTLLALLLLATSAPLIHSARQHLTTEYECLIRSSAIEYAAATLPTAVNDVRDALQYQQMCGSASDNAHVYNSAELSPTEQVDDDTLTVHVDAQLGVDSHASPLLSSSFQSVEFALEMIRKALQTSSHKYRLALKSGQTHFLSQPLVLTAADSNLTITSDTNSVPAMLTTGKQLKYLQWDLDPQQQPSTGVLHARLPQSVDVDNLAAFNSLFINGKRMQRARYPNADPEYQGLHTPSHTGWIQKAKQWRAPRTPKTPAMDFQVNEPTRSKSHFWEHQLGVGGTASEFDPPTNFWSSAAPPAGVTYKVPSGVTMHDEDAKQLENTYIDSPNAVVAVHAMHCLHWESWVFRVDTAASRWKDGDVRFASGGVQGARGCETGAEYWFENILGQLDAPNEFYVDESQRMLYLYPNMTTDELQSAEIIASQTPELIQIIGTDRNNPVVGIELRDIQMSYTATSYLLPKSYSVPSGGDWSIQRIAAVTLRNTEDVYIRKCLFKNLGGNAILVNGYNQHTGIANNEFTLLGDSAIVLLGETSGIDAYTNLNQPTHTSIISNHIHEIGLYIKQCAGVFSSMSHRNEIIGNVIYNIPRAAVCLNDMFGSMNNLLAHNLLFNTVRESADHGPINSWDRQPYIVADRHGQPTVWDTGTSKIVSNFLVNAYSSVWPVDHDDGSANYLTQSNLMVAGGKKNYMGHSLTTLDNIYLFPDAMRFGSEDAQGWLRLV